MFCLQLMTTLHEGGRKHYNLMWMFTALAVCNSTVGIAGQCLCVAVWPMCVALVSCGGDDVRWWLLLDLFQDGSERFNTHL